MRREIPLFITAVLGVFMILSFFIPHPWVQDTTETLRNWFIIIAAFAFVLGMGNLVRVNLHRVKRRGEDWGYKVVTLVALFGYLAVGLVLGTGIDIRKSWLTRTLGLVESDRKVVLEGRLRLFSRQDEVARLLTEAGSEEEGTAALTAEYGTDQAVAPAIPALVALGPDGVRALDARELSLAILGAKGAKEPWRREIQSLEGQLAVTGVRPLVLDRIEGGAVVSALRSDLEFKLEPAQDIAALGAAGIAALDRGAIRTELDALKSAAPDESVRNAANWVFKYMYSPLQATMFSLLAFFIASAAFRAFRMRTVEAGILLTAGVLVMFGRVPLGQFDWGITTEHFGFDTIMNWIMNVPMTAAMRGILMGAAMGVIVMGIKVILGIERSYLGGD